MRACWRFLFILLGVPPFLRAATPAKPPEISDEAITQLPKFEVQEAAISNFGMSIVTNREVLWGGEIVWMTVGAVVPGSSAALAGLKPNDRIILLDDVSIRKIDRLTMLHTFFERPVGTRLKVLLRDGKTRIFRQCELVVNAKRLERAN